MDNPHLDLPALPPEMAALAPGFLLDDPMDAPDLRWGIIGAGGIAGVFADDVPAYSSGRVTAVGARSLDRAQAFADEHGIPTAYGSYEELVSSPDIDAVYVATVHTFHAEHALLALRAGKPVLVEKGFTVNADQARQVFAEAESRGLAVMEAMWSRHLPHYRLINAIAANGGLGSLTQVHADHSQSLLHVERVIEPALSGGAMLDITVYPMSFIHMLAGAPSSLQATGVLHPSGVDLGETITMTHLDGTAEASESTPRAGRVQSVATAAIDGRSATYGEAIFENGCLEMPLQFYRPGILRLRTFGDTAPEDGATVDWDATVPGGFQYQAAEFARMIADGRTQSDRITWQDTIEVMEMMDAARAQLGVRYPFE